MEQEATDKLNGLDGHVFDLMGMSVLVGEKEHALFEQDDAVIGDGHPMGVATHVVKDVLRVFHGFWMFTTHFLENKVSFSSWNFSGF
jgi:hypothetical protein